MADDDQFLDDDQTVDPLAMDDPEMLDDSLGDELDLVSGEDEY